jgi:uncharacterized oxidoreductase
MQGNTIFITGGTSGIGQGLAEAFHERGNRVIISGRREDRLQATCARLAGMAYYALDVTNAEAIKSVARKVTADFPELNWVINNAGVQMRVEFSADGKLDEQRLQAEINTNVLGPMRVTAAFLPHLAQRAGATVVNVSSGLAFVPMARYAVYCATKAAVHSWTMSLRHQLQGSGVKVIEIIPPWVATELGGAGKPATSADGRVPMPLDAFIAETMKELESGAEEVAVADAKRLVAATSPETVRKIFSYING